MAHGHGEHEEADWARNGLVRRGRLAGDQSVAAALNSVYHGLFHRRFLVHPRVLAYISVGAPAAEYLLWDAVLRASGAWDWELRGLEMLASGSSDGYSAVVHLADDFTGVALLREGQRCAGDLMQVGSGDISHLQAARSAAAMLFEVFSSYSRDVNPDEAGLLAGVRVRVYTEVPEDAAGTGLEEGLGRFETGGMEILREDALCDAVRKALGGTPPAQG